MTVTIDQAVRGVLRFADNEVIPHLMEDIKGQLLALRENPFVKIMQIIGEDGNIELDRLYSAARPRFENKLSVSVPLLGKLHFDQGDVDKLYKYIQEA